MTVHKINPGAARARKVGQVLLRTVLSNLENQGEQLAGFALVTWDARGEAQTSFQTAAGPIGRTMVAAYVGNALVQHVAASLAQETPVEIITP